MSFLKRFFLILFFMGILGSFVYFVEPPKSWYDASIVQILIIFLPLLFLLTLIVDILFQNLSKSFITSLSLIFLIVLWIINKLNLITLALTFIPTVLLLTAAGKKGKIHGFRRIRS